MDTITESDGMSDFKYRQLLDYCRDEVRGVGESTRSAIDESFEGGDNFIEVVEHAYRDAEYGRLTEIDGIGDTTAERIALGIAEKEGWSGGSAESAFDLS